MNALGGFVTHVLMSFLFLVFFAGKSGAGKNDGDMADWQNYSNPESHFTFQYPRDWEITDDFFYKTLWSVTLQKIGGAADSENWIRVNSPQFQEEDGVCVQIGEERLCTYSRDADVLKIFKGVAASFKLKNALKGN
jgi:hypothetical protein